MTSFSYVDAMHEALSRLDSLGYERADEGSLRPSHGPMAAEALATLGYGAQAVAWAERYRPVMPPRGTLPAAAPLDPRDEGSWRPALGRLGRVGDWERLFGRELSDGPWPEVLACWWPRLLPGTPGRLAHGLLRTAHAVRGLAVAGESGDAQRGELARGLAYWAATYACLPGSPGFGGSWPPAAVASALPRTALSAADRAGSGFSRERIRGLARHPGYLDALTAAAPLAPQLLLSEMTTHFAGVYLAHPEISPVPLVHGVTIPAAVRLVLPHLPEALHRPSAAAAWQLQVTLLAGFTGQDEGEDTAADLARRTAAPPWAELAARAAEHGDEHVIKLTEASLREHALRPDPRFAAAVLAALDRIPHR